MSEAQATQGEAGETGKAEAGQAAGAAGEATSTTATIAGTNAGAAGAAAGEAAGEAGKETNGAAANGEAAKPEAYWKDDWRDQVAKHVAAGDDKTYKKELARLGRIADPSGLYGMYRELEGKFTSGNLAKIPGKDATEDEVKAFRKAQGVPEKADDYFENLELDNGAKLGDMDMPVAKEFAAKMHEIGAPPAIMKQAFNWYLERQESEAAQVDQADDTHRKDAEVALKEEFGASFERKTNAIPSLFAQAPGGLDVSNPNALISRFLGGRTTDGRLIGNDPDMVKFLSSLALDVNPAQAVMEDGMGSAKTVDDEIKEIEQSRRDNKAAYFKDENLQARYRQLLDARSRIQAKG